MKSFFFSTGILLLLSTGISLARCTNDVHVKKINNTICPIKGNDKKIFSKDGTCQNCGCPQIDHDNESK